MPTAAPFRYLFQTQQQPSAILVKNVITLSNRINPAARPLGLQDTEIKLKWITQAGHWMESTKMEMKGKAE